MPESDSKIGLRVIVDRITIILLGVPLGLMFVVLLAFGRVKIRGYMRAVRLACRGRLIIASNHPSMLETFLIPLSFFPLNILLLRLFVWSVPDRRLLPRRLRWLFWLTRCITIDRTQPNKNKHTLEKMTEVLEAGGVVVVHPEAGRTGKGTSFIHKDDRRLRGFLSSVPTLARRTNAMILPLWVSGAERVLPIGSMFPRLWRSKIVLSFGVPYKPGEREKGKAEESLILAQAMLNS